MSVYQRRGGLWVASISVGPRTARRRYSRYAKTRSQAEAIERELVVGNGLTRGDRFWDRVEKSDDCWLWRGTIVKGYGMFGSGRSRRLAHRVAWELSEGPIPTDRLVLHSCASKACVRPAHLRLGSQRDNMRDRRELAVA